VTMELWFRSDGEAQGRSDTRLLGREATAEDGEEDRDPQLDGGGRRRTARTRRRRR
jgi:hypothetical protein